MSTLVFVFQFQCMSCALTFSTHSSECRDKTPHMPGCFRWNSSLWHPGLLVTHLGQPGVVVSLPCFVPCLQKVRCYLHCDPTGLCASHPQTHMPVVIKAFYYKMHYEACGFVKIITHHVLGPDIPGSFTPQSALLIMTQQYDCLPFLLPGKVFAQSFPFFQSGSHITLSQNSFSRSINSGMETNPIPSPGHLILNLFMSLMAPTYLIILFVLFFMYMLILSTLLLHETIFRRALGNTLITL